MAAPPGLFATGRLGHPLTTLSRLGAWAGLPIPPSALLPPVAADFEKVIEAQSPLEAALVVGGEHSPREIGAVVSLGLTSFAGAVEEARAHGLVLHKLAPGVMKLEGTEDEPCAVAVALGKAPARLVCAPTDGDLERLLPFATRGLPMLDLGARDLEIAVKAAPLRDAYRSRLAGLRMLSGFLVRRWALDAPRFDRALADALDSLADELVLLVDDLDSVTLGGVVDEGKGQLRLELAVALADQRSFSARLVGDFAKHRGTAPDVFFGLPGDAQGARYSRGLDVQAWAAVRTSLADVVDAYLEQKGIDRAARTRVGRLIGLYFDLGGGVQASAHGPVPGNDEGYSLGVVDLPAKRLSDALSDLSALLSDRKVRAFAATLLGVDEKALPTAKLVPLAGAGIPRGTRGLTFNVPKELAKQLGSGLTFAQSSAGLASGGSHTVAVAPRGDGAVFCSAATPDAVAERLSAFLAGRGPTLADRPELASFRDLMAQSAMFETPEGLIASVAQSLGKHKRGPAVGPAGTLPIVLRFDATPSPLAGTFILTVPRDAFHAIPALVAVLLQGHPGLLGMP